MEAMPIYKLLGKHVNDAIERMKQVKKHKNDLPFDPLYTDLLNKDVFSANDLVYKEFPDGSGYDNGTKIAWDKCRLNKIVLRTGFHHMDQHGFYCGWTNHDIIITPNFCWGYNMRITGPNKMDIKSYISDTFDFILMKEICPY